MTDPQEPVIVFHGRNEFEAQMARDVLREARIPTIHLPSLSTGVFGVAQTTSVVVPRDQVEKALDALRDAGMTGERQDVPRGFAAFRDAVNDRLPAPTLPNLPGSRLRRVIVGLAVAIAAVAALLLFTRP